MSDYNPKWDKDDDRPIHWPSLIGTLVIFAAIVGGVVYGVWQMVTR